MDIFNEKSALDFESSRKDLLERSERRAWFIALSAILAAAALALAIMFLTPLKTVQPYVIKVDNSTGGVEIITVLDVKQIPVSESLDKYFVNDYVVKREGYYYDLLAEDYVAVQLMSSQKIAEEYRSLYAGKTGRAEVLQDKKEVEVKTISIVLGESAGTKTATIRARISEKELSTKITKSSLTVITLAYEYIPTTQQSEKERLINPLGFTVTSYRKDSEVTENE